MGIAVNQCDGHQNVIIWTFDSQFTLEEYRTALAASIQISEKFSQSFDVIANLLGCEKLIPDAFFELEDTSTIIQNNLRSVAIVGANVMIRTIISAFCQSDSQLGNKIYFAETMDQARQLVCPNFNHATGFFDTQELPSVRLSP